MNVDSWRWQGVPFYIRAGKSLPVTCTEIVVRLRQPPTVFPTCCRAPNYFRFRISPDVTAAFGLTVMDQQEKMIGEQVEMLASHYPGAEEMDAYERVLGDAMAGDATLFAREDYVEEAWRIVDPVLKAGTPVYEYEPGTWGPSEVDQRVAPPGGWQNPTMSRLKDWSDGSMERWSIGFVKTSLRLPSNLNVGTAMKIEILTDADAVARKAAEIIAAEARATVAARGRFIMAVSGGHTPWKMLRALANEEVPWEGRACGAGGRACSASRTTRIEISLTCVKACSSMRRCDPSRSMPCRWSRPIWTPRPHATQ